MKSLRIFKSIFKNSFSKALTNIILLNMDNKNNYILIFLLVVFFFLFYCSREIHSSIISSTQIFMTSIVPSMFPMFIMIDLLLNYGLSDLLYRSFKTNSMILVILSLLSGTPSNAKYIKEFRESGYISRDLGNFLLLFSYSPNPLFILGISPDKEFALKIIFYIYITNILVFLLFKRHFKDIKSYEKKYDTCPFVECLSNSIYKSFKVLILILGIVITFGIVNTLLDILNLSNPFLSSLIELTNACHIITNTSSDPLWLIFAASFGSLSIHAQIKSILEETDLSYRYFFVGRFLSSLPILLYILYT